MLSRRVQTTKQTLFSQQAQQRSLSVYRQPINIDSEEFFSTPPGGKQCVGKKWAKKKQQEKQTEEGDHIKKKVKTNGYGLQQDQRRQNHRKDKGDDQSSSQSQSQGKANSFIEIPQFVLPQPFDLTNSNYRIHDLVLQLERLFYLMSKNGLFEVPSTSHPILLQAYLEGTSKLKNLITDQMECNIIKSQEFVNHGVVDRFLGYFIKNQLNQDSDLLGYAKYLFEIQYFTEFDMALFTDLGSYNAIQIYQGQLLFKIMEERWKVAQKLIEQSTQPQQMDNPDAIKVEALVEQDRENQKVKKVKQEQQGQQQTQKTATENPEKVEKPKTKLELDVEKYMTDYPVHSMCYNVLVAQLKIQTEYGNFRIPLMGKDKAVASWETVCNINEVELLKDITKKEQDEIEQKLKMDPYPYKHTELAMLGDIIVDLKYNENSYILQSIQKYRQDSQFKFTQILKVTLEFCSMKQVCSQCIQFLQLKQQWILNKLEQLMEANGDKITIVDKNLYKYATFMQITPTQPDSIQKYGCLTLDKTATGLFSAYFFKKRYQVVKDYQSALSKLPIKTPLDKLERTHTIYLSAGNQMLEQLHQQEINTPQQVGQPQLVNQQQLVDQPQLVDSIQKKRSGSKSKSKRSNSKKSESNLKEGNSICKRIKEIVETQEFMQQ